MKFKKAKVLSASAVAALICGMAACSEDVVAPQNPGENAIPGQEVGIKELKVSMPRLKRFDVMVDHLSCRIHLRGRNDRVSYPVKMFLTADEDSIYIEADDPILAELPHQMYHLNAISFPRKNLTTREDESVVEDTIYVGARLSIENPDRIGFRSSFNVAANSIGSGTKADPWIVASGDDFMLRISDPMTRGETHEGKYFEITRNLNLNTAAVASGKGWEPAGHNNINGGSTDFNGTIDGCDNYIENLYCYTDAGYGGLFYSLGDKAYIHNLEMRRVMLSGNSNLGAFACYSKKGCRLDSIQVNGTIEGTGNLGGLIGSGDADVRVCISSIDVVSATNGDGSIGGMIGHSTQSSFTDCIRTGRIDAPAAKCVGGYVGKGIADKGDSNAMTQFTRCYVSGSIAGKIFVGGFAGNASAEFTNCHAGATLPQNSYAYTIQWDIFGINNMMTPMPLEVEGVTGYTGGFAGCAPKMILHGENSFAYSSPAKPNITSGGYATGALAGECYGYYGESSAKFTSYAYVKGGDATGGVMGACRAYDRSTFVNYGNVVGKGDTGGVIGQVYLDKDQSFRINCKNTGNVQGTSCVGGVIGDIEGRVENAILENDGNVEGSGKYVGGLLGASMYVDLAEGSHVSSVGGSLKISGDSHVGGITGDIEPASGDPLAGSYCPVYANIISSAGRAGGLFGYAVVTGVKSKEMFGRHYPVKVSITVKGGDNVGGAIGYLEAKDGDGISISGFSDNLQASITTAGNIAGGIVGRVVRNGCQTVFSGCHSFASVSSTATSEVSGFGGIVGWSEDTGYRNYKKQPRDISINKSSFHGSLSGSSMTAAGGIIGHSAEGVYINTSYNAGRVDAVRAVGGIAGRINNAGNIRACFNMGEVPSASGRTWLAGILGQKEDNSASAVNITQCYNVGKTGWGIIGGEDKCKFSCNDCYYLDSASNGDMKNSGTHSKTADEMRRKSTFGGWSASTWEFHEGTAAPTLVGVPMFDSKLPLQK